MYKMEFEIKQISEFNLGSLEPLAFEAQSEGYGFVQKTIDEWKNGVNTFSKKGEILLGIFKSDLCIGIGGLNVDPYIDDPSTGRIRHVYISKNHRRKGFAKLLLNKIMRISENHFDTIRLLTTNPAAVCLYESFGFVKVTTGINVSHILSVDRS
jgi:ribosomal protein S18 acetylase RimI-like enzyme